MQQHGGNVALEMGAEFQDFKPKKFLIEKLKEKLDLYFLLCFHNTRWLLTRIRIYNNKTN